MIGGYKNQNSLKEIILSSEMLFNPLSDIFCLSDVGFGFFIGKRIDIFQKNIESRLFEVYCFADFCFGKQRTWYYIHLTRLVLHSYAPDALWVSIYKMGQYYTTFCHNFAYISSIIDLIKVIF